MNPLGHAQSRRQHLDPHRFDAAVTELPSANSIHLIAVDDVRQPLQNSRYGTVLTSAGVLYGAVSDVANTTFAGHRPRWEGSVYLGGRAILMDGEKQGRP